jgi:excisionase family DNA binding protein
MTSKYMTPKQVAEELEVSAATVVRWVRYGTVSAKRFGHRIIRIPRIEVERLLGRFPSRTRSTATEVL